jgi:hypothetical protein
LLQDLSTNVVVELELDDGSDRIIIVLRGVVVDVCLGGGVAEGLGAGPWRGDALELTDERPPSLVEGGVVEVAGVEPVFELGHGAGGEGDEDDGGAVEGGIEEEEDRVGGFDLGRDEADFFQVGSLARGQADQVADSLVEGAVGAASQDVGDLGSRVADVVINMPELVVGGGEPAAVGLDGHEAADVILEVDVPGAGVAVFLPS